MTLPLPPSSGSGVSAGRWLRRTARGLLAALALLLARPAWQASAATEGSSAPDRGGRLLVVVNPHNRLSSVERSFVAQAFLKKVHQWPDGQTINPVDLARSSAVRRIWSKQWLGRSVEAVTSYWQQLIFAGRELPPPELPSEEEVVTYVLRNPGGIGYVSGDASLRGAKVLTLE